MDKEPVILRILWPVLAALAGSLTALSTRPYAKMSRVDIGFSLFVGFTFAVFVGPFLVDRWIPNGDSHLQGAAYYMFASGAHVFVPLGIKWIKGKFGVVEDATP